MALEGALGAGIVRALGLAGGALGIAAVAYRDELKAWAKEGLLFAARNSQTLRTLLDDDLRFILDSEDKFAKIELLLPIDQKIIFFNLMTHYLTLVKQGQSSSSLIRFRTAVNTLLSFPRTRHAIIPEATVIKLKSKIQEDYPDNQEDICTYIDQLVLFINDRQNNIPAHKPNPLLLLGPAGVGKTRFIQELIAEELEIPIHFAIIANQGTQFLEGEVRANLCNGYVEGVLYCALQEAARSKYKTLPVIVFFDDICAAFAKSTERSTQQEAMSWLTKTFDPANQSFVSHLFDNYIDAHGDINGITFQSDDFIFICAANSPHFMLTEGLQRRLRSKITFHDLTPEKKKSILLAYTTKLKSEYAITLSTEDEEQLLKIAEIDPYPGAATMIDTINKWFANKRCGSQFNIERYYTSLGTQEVSLVHQAEDNAYLPAYAASKHSRPAIAARSTDVVDDSHNPPDPDIESLTSLFESGMSLNDPKVQEMLLEMLGTKQKNRIRY